MSDSKRIVRLIIAREWRDAWRDHSLSASLSLLLALAMITGGLGWLRHSGEQQRRTQYQELVRRQWMQQPDRHPHRVAHYGYLTFRPPAPLGFLDSGVEAFTGSVLYLEAHRTNSPDVGEAAYASGLSRFGDLSPSAVLGMVVPLIVIVTGAAAVSRERENGTLALVVAQGCPPSLWLAARTVAQFCALGLPAVLLCGIGALLISPADWQRVLLFCAAHSAHLLTWCTIASVVGARASSARASLVLLLSVWAVCCILIPRLLPAVAATVWPEVTAAEIEERVEQDLASAADAHNPDDPRFASFRDRILRQYNVKRIEDLPVNFNGLVMEDSEALTREVFLKWHDARQRTRSSQESLLKFVAFLNPFLANRGLSMQAAGSDRSYNVEFEEQAETFRYAMIQRLNELHTRNIRIQNDRAQKVSRDEWQKQAVFRFAPMPVLSSLSADPVYLVASCAWALAGLAGLWIAGRKLAVPQ